MSGGLIQLAAYGVQDLYLTREPQITFFKIVYRRYTNFSVEPIVQNFNSTPTFGSRSTCTISRTGDLVGQTYVVIQLPCINTCCKPDSISLFAWVKKIGFAIIKRIRIEIGGYLIDDQYGEWLNLWHELFGPREVGFDNMIGNVPELFNFSVKKDVYELYVPLQFWFCRSAGLALPLIALQYSEVQIVIELNEFDKCYIKETHYIETYNDIVNLHPYEYMEQEIDGVKATGIFTRFDPLEKKVYYIKTSRHDFQSLCTHNYKELPTLEKSNLVFTTRNKKYNIKGTVSNYSFMPELTKLPMLIQNQTCSPLTIVSCFLLVDYIYLDTEERVRFIKSKIDYLIEQVIFVPERVVDSPTTFVKLNIYNPCKLLVWVTQLSYIQCINDTFNYTDRHRCGGKSLIACETIRLNSYPILSKRGYQYFNYVEPYQYCTYSPSEGVNIYSFSLFPEKVQPSGSCNMSQIDDIEIDITLNKCINVEKDCVKFRAYALTYNVLRIVNGIAGLVFIR